MAVSRENNNELSSSIKMDEVLNSLSDYQFLKEGSVPLINLVEIHPIVTAADPIGSGCGCIVAPTSNTTSNRETFCS